MIRTLLTGIKIWKHRGILWPLKLTAAIAGNRIQGFPRGLIVEPSQECTGKCSGCRRPENPITLTPEKLEGYILGRPARPATIHFAGKHSDPLSSLLFPDLVRLAARHCSMVSVSTIGLGLQDGWECLPVDRWIVSIPAATEDTWFQLRGNRRFTELRENLMRLLSVDKSMVELVLTLWRQSAEDRELFHRFAREMGISSLKVVFGRYDPMGNHFGRVGNLALKVPGCPYVLDNEVRLKNEPARCPLTGTLFLDASGFVHPCPFTESSDLSPMKIERSKRERSHSACRYCF